MVEATDATAPAPDLLPVGSKVEVRTGFDGSWAGGFEVAGHDGDEYLLRRRSDDVQLPAAVAASQVRRERKSMWWM